MFILDKILSKYTPYMHNLTSLNSCKSTGLVDWVTLHLKFCSVHILQLDGISGYHVDYLQI